jgi:hypothetical protein
LLRWSWSTTPEWWSARSAASPRRRARAGRCSGLTVIHRHGRISSGEPIVLVLAASAHRAAAFDAASFLMDYLKTRAPFWKKEHRIDGSEGEWVAAKAADEAAAGGGEALRLEPIDTGSVERLPVALQHLLLCFSRRPVDLIFQHFAHAGERSARDLYDGIPQSGAHQRLGAMQIRLLDRDADQCRRQPAVHSSLGAKGEISVNLRATVNAQAFIDPGTRKISPTRESSRMFSSVSSRLLPGKSGTTSV